MSDAIKSHYTNFAVSIIHTAYKGSGVTTSEDRRSLYIWSYYEIKNRWREYRKANKRIGMTLGDYFWGKGKQWGYLAESYGTHLALKHDDVFYGENYINQITQDVVQEHGGWGSHDLFMLLKSSKGNTNAHLSGDIVVIDSKGFIQLNIQSKATKKMGYSFALTYKKFLNDVQTFINIYDNAKINGIEQQDIDQLFNIFSTTAWQEIQTDVDKNINKIVTDTTNSFLINNKMT